MQLLSEKKLNLTFLSIAIFILLFALVLDENLVLEVDKNNRDIEVNTKYKLPSYKATLMGMDISDKVVVESSININKLGSYKVIYKLDYLVFKLKKEIIINVLDKTLPEISLNGDTEVRLCPGSEYEEQGYVAFDNYDGDITDKVKINTKEDLIEYIVYDTSNNQTIETRKLVYLDETAPNLKIQGKEFYQINLNSKFNVPSYEVYDDCDEDIASKVEVISTLDTSKVGTYKIKYSVKDESGNEASKEITIKVIGGGSSNSYSNIVMGPTYINGILIVNKKYALPSNYGSGVDAEALEALKKLQNAAGNLGYSMPLLSGYRSYDTQRNLYNSYVSRDGVANADRYSARPGHSEHQTGLAFDVGAINNNYGNTKEGIWLRENAHLYGFIIRYPNGKEHITGYMYEPWHIRYVGTTHAKKIYESGLTLEEYLGV